MLKTTETLLEGLAKGDDTRWARFYRDYAPFLEDFLAGKFRLPYADAEDAISETLIEIAKIMPTYRYDPERKGRFHSLLLSIARNKAIDILRKQTKEQEHIAELETATIEVPPDAWRREIMNAAIRRVFADPTVRETSKVAFRRYVQLGESAETVARELGIEVNALYQIKNRLTARIKAEVERLTSEFPDGI